MEAPTPSECPMQSPWEHLDQQPQSASASGNQMETEGRCQAHTPVSYTPTPVYQSTSHNLSLGFYQRDSIKHLLTEPQNWPSMDTPVTQTSHPSHPLSYSRLHFYGVNCLHDYRMAQPPGRPACFLHEEMQKWTSMTMESNQTPYPPPSRMLQNNGNSLDCSQNNNTIPLPGSTGDMTSCQLRNPTSSIPQGAPGDSPHSSQKPPEEVLQKRELRLMKNREAARECRRKKKEYVRCLENRVAVLENQNKTLIEELRALKDIYRHKVE